MFIVISIVWLLMIGDFQSKGNFPSVPRHHTAVASGPPPPAGGRGGKKRERRGGAKPRPKKARRKRRPAAALQKKGRLEAGATKYETSRLSPGTETLEGLARVAP